MNVSQRRSNLASGVRNTDYTYPDIQKLKMERGLALQDLIGGTYEVLETVELPKQSRVYLLDALATCEYVNHACCVQQFKELTIDLFGVAQASPFGGSIRKGTTFELVGVIQDCGRTEPEERVAVPRCHCHLLCDHSYIHTVHSPLIPSSHHAPSYSINLPKCINPNFMRYENAPMMSWRNDLSPQMTLIIILDSVETLLDQFHSKHVSVTFANPASHGVIVATGKADVEHQRASSRCCWWSRWTPR